MNQPLPKREPTRVADKETEAERRQQSRDLINEVTMLKDKLGRAGLFRTMQKMTEVEREIGYEVAELLPR